MFQTLTQNLKGYPEQKAANALVTDKEGELYKFNISSNSEASSSIYDLREHKQLWPEVVFTNTVHLKSTTLPTVVRDAGMSGVAFDALILDVQGAELLVVKGAGQVLDSIRFIKAEAADFESYRGGCTAATLSKALEERGFRIHMKERFASKEGVGSYYNIIYCRNV